MSKLTEEIKKLSKKLDDIDRRVELIEDKQPKITVKVSTGGDSSTSEPKFKVGDSVIPHKPKDENESPTWDRSKDKYDGEILTVAGITVRGNLRVDVDDDDFYFNPSWCTKVEEPYFPKDGEYFYAKNKSATSEFISIYDFTDDNGEQHIFVKATLSLASNNCYIREKSGVKSYALIKDAMNIRPATSEEKALLDSKLAEKGLIFDGKDVVKDNTPKIGDFCIFWDYDKGIAFCSILEKITNYPECKYITRRGVGYIYCIKFESVEQFKKIKEGK